MEWGLKRENEERRVGGEGGAEAFIAEKRFSRKQILRAGLLLEGKGDFRWKRSCF